MVIVSGFIGLVFSLKILPSPFEWFESPNQSYHDACMRIIKKIENNVVNKDMITKLKNEAENFRKDNVDFEEQIFISSVKFSQIIRGFNNKING